MFIFHVLLTSAESDHFQNVIIFLCFLSLYMKCLLVYPFFGFLCSTAVDSVGAAHLEKCDIIVVTIRTFSRQRNEANNRTRSEFLCSLPLYKKV